MMREDKDLVDVIEKIKFEIFAHAYRKYYVGNDSPELRIFISTSTASVITSIRAWCVHLVTKRRINLSPDDVFKKMTNYVILLPDEAGSLMLSLAETFLDCCQRRCKLVCYSMVS